MWDTAVFLIFTKKTMSSLLIHQVLDAHLYVWVSGVRNVRFLGNLACFSFLETPALRFALLPYYR